ncbi:MAG: cell division protein FtsQ, partial [Pseudomonadota bacterium]
MRSLIRRFTSDTEPHDPAPSKLDYKWQRLMLTPGFRATVRIGMPLILIAAIVGSWYSKPENRAALAAQIAAAKQSFQDRPQFMVQRLYVSGADAETTAAVRELLPQDYPMSSFDLDLEGLRATIEALDPIKTASVRVGQGGVLEVQLIPRVPAALWRDGTLLRLIDGDGVQSGTVASRAD